MKTVPHARDSDVGNAEGRRHVLGSLLAVGAAFLASATGRAHAKSVTNEAGAGHAGLTDGARVVAIEEIRGLKARYCWAVDEHDWKELRDVFADDATVHFPLPDGKLLATPDAFVDFLSEAMTPNIQTRHQVYNLKITFTSPTEATAQWQHENWTWFEDGSRPNLHQWGEYRERYKKTSAGWRVSFFSEANLRNAPAARARRAASADPNP
jgi:hypothetical protein